MTTKDKHLFLNDLCTRLSYKDVDKSVTLAEILPLESADMRIGNYVDKSVTLAEIDGYLEQQIQTYKHLQDTLCVLEGIVDVLDVVTKKIN